MGVIWLSTHSARDWTVWARAGGLAAIVLIATPILIYFALPAGAQNVPPASGTPTINAPNNQGIVTQGQTGGTNVINPLPPRDPAGLYQNGEKIGHVEGPTINEATGTVAFQVTSFNAYPDPEKPIEYGSLLLQSKEFPRKRPDQFVGQLSATIIGLQCYIVGRK